MDVKNSMSDKLKAHGAAIGNSMKNLSEAAKRDPILKSCSPEMMKPRSGLISTGDNIPKPPPMPYIRCHKTVKWL